MASSSIANETVDHAAERGRFTLYKLITNTYFLYCVSIVAFFSLWHWTAAEKIFRDSLATPAQVLDQMIRLTGMKFAGTNLWGHIWASFQRVISALSWPASWPCLWACSWL